MIFLFFVWQASSFLQQGKYEEAEAALNEALEKDPANADALINMIALAQHTGKAPEVGGREKEMVLIAAIVSLYYYYYYYYSVFQVSNRYLTQLKDDHPSHPFVAAFRQKEADFDKMVKNYAVSA